MIQKNLGNFRLTSKWQSTDSLPFIIGAKLK